MVSLRPNAHSYAAARSKSPKPAASCGPVSLFPIFPYKPITVVVIVQLPGAAIALTVCGDTDCRAGAEILLRFSW